MRLHSGKIGECAFEGMGGAAQAVGILLIDGLLQSAQITREIGTEEIDQFGQERPVAIETIEQLRNIN